MVVRFKVKFDQSDEFARMPDAHVVAPLKS
jgi:hypothetical protein